MIIKRRRFKQIQTLEDRLAEGSRKAREEARLLPPGIKREELLRRARRNEVAANMSQWLRSPGLSAPT